MFQLCYLRSQRGLKDDTSSVLSILTDDVVFHIIYLLREAQGYLTPEELGLKSSCGLVICDQTSLEDISYSDSDDE